MVAAIAQQFAGWMEVDLNIISKAPFRNPIRLIAASAALLLGAAACSVFEPDGPVRIAAIGAVQNNATPASGAMSAATTTIWDATAQGLISFDAEGHIEAGLAERWTVTTDGRSYIFRIREAKWPDGRKVTAQQVANILKSYIRPSSRHPLKAEFVEVENIHAMTDNVLEIRLRLPQPMLLELLAQPSMALVGRGSGWNRGWGPMRVRLDDSSDRKYPTLIFSPAPDPLATDQQDSARGNPDAAPSQMVELVAVSAPRALARFKNGYADAVIGGRFADLPYFHSSNIPRSRLQIDPTFGLFGLLFQQERGFWAHPNHRLALSALIRRDRLIRAFRISDWPIQIGLRPAIVGDSDLPPPALPIWANQGDAAHVAEMQRLIARAAADDGGDAPTLRIALPDGPGSTILFGYIAADFARAGITAQRVAAGAAADLRLIDEVAPNDDPIWPLRRLSCRADTLCDQQIDALITESGRQADPAERTAKIMQAEADMLRSASFLPLAAPLRWTVSTLRFTGIQPNDRAHHPLNRLTSATK